MKTGRLILCGIAIGVAVLAINVTAAARSVPDMIEQMRAWLYPRRPAPLPAPEPVIIAPEPEPEPVVVAPQPEPVVKPAPVERKAKPVKRTKQKPKPRRQAEAVTTEWLPPCSTVCWYAAGKTRAALAAEASTRNPSAAMRRHALACLRGCRS